MNRISETYLHKWSTSEEGVPRVFISYSHNDFGPYVDQFANELINNNIACWLDVSVLQPSVDWEAEIEKGINECDYFLFFMTKLSIKRPDGYCIKEISYAQQSNKIIIPIKIEDIPPLIGFDTLQQIDMTKTFSQNDKGEIQINETKYKLGMKLLLDFILCKKPLDSDNGYRRLAECLKPIPQSHYFADRTIKGCERIEEELNNWIDCDLSQNFYQDVYSKNVICYTAKTGSGKTTFTSNYCKNRDDVLGVHFCKMNSTDRGSAKRVLMTLAFSLANRNPEYRMFLNRVPNLEEIETLPASSVYENLFILPFSKMKDRPKSVVLVIDGLDETTDDNSDDSIINFIIDTIIPSNSGLRFILTTRPEEWVLEKLNKSKIEIKRIAQTDYEIDKCISYYLSDTLDVLLKKGVICSKEMLDHYISIIIQKAEHSFVYATWIARDLIKKDTLSIDDINVLPQGMVSIYYSAFQQIFYSTNSKAEKYNITFEEAKEVLKVIVAQYQRLTLSQISLFLKSNNISNSTYVLNNTLGVLSSFFSIIPLNKQESKDMSSYTGPDDVIDEQDFKTVEAVHSSLIDWLVSSDAAKFQVALEEAHLSMANHYRKEVEDGNFNVYSCNFYISHLIAADKHKEALDYICDSEYQQLRTKVVGYVVSVNDYTKEIFLYLNKYKDSRPMDAKKIFESATFKRFIGNYRKFFYNQRTTYKKLKDVGFSSFCDEHMGSLTPETAKVEDLPFLTGIVDYLYINEIYVKTTKYSKQVIKCFELGQIPDDILVELYKMLSLSYRKRGKLEECFKYSEKCSEHNTDNKCNYDVGVVNLIVGKTYYHCLDFKNGHDTIELGINQLLSTIAKEPTKVVSYNDDDDDDDDDDEVVVVKKQEVDVARSVAASYEYFLFILFYTAAFHRELVLLDVWNYNLEDAKKEIDKIEEIYARKDYTIDRYYVRYLYCKMFYQILNKEASIAVKEYSNTIVYAVTSYEKSQVVFITALGYYALNNMKEATAYINDALEIVDSKKNFEVYEKGEIYILSDIIKGELKKEEDFDFKSMFVRLYGISIEEALENGTQNEFNIKSLSNWLSYVVKFIFNLKNIYK